MISSTHMSIRIVFLGAILLKLWKLGFDQSDSVGSSAVWGGGRARAPLAFGMVALSSGWTGGQAPQPRSGAPKTQGLTARTSPSDPHTGLNATRPDIVCRMKSRILHQ